MGKAERTVEPSRDVLPCIPLYPNCQSAGRPGAVTHDGSRLCKAKALLLAVPAAERMTAQRRAATRPQ